MQSCCNGELGDMGLAERSAAAAITALALLVTLLVMYAPKLRLVSLDSRCTLHGCMHCVIAG